MINLERYEHKSQKSLQNIQIVKININESERTQLKRARDQIKQQLKEESKKRSSGKKQGSDLKSPKLAKKVIKRSKKNLSSKSKS